MSQEKVDYYKEQKKNRKKIMRREKIRTRLGITAAVVIFAALIGWFGWAVYNNQKENAEAAAGAQTTTLNLTMMESYQTQLSNYCDTLKKEEDSGETSSDSTASSESVSADSAASSSTDASADSVSSTSGN